VLKQLVKRSLFAWIHHQLPDVLRTVFCTDPYGRNVTHAASHGGKVFSRFRPTIFGINQKRGLFDFVALVAFISSMISK